MRTENSISVPQFPYEFCEGTENYGTYSSGRQSRTYCIRKTQNEDVYPRTYANDRQIIGQFGRENADYCPVSERMDDTNIKGNSNYVGNCYLGDGNYGSFIFNNDNRNYTNEKYNEAIGQIYGNNSFCALSSLLPKGTDLYMGIRIKPICYPMFCTNESLTIQIGQQYFVCPQNGGIINSIQNYDGYIYCPEYNLICSGTELCNNMFDCVDKKSESKSKDALPKYTINTTSDGSVIEGEYIYENLVKSNVSKGYERSDDDNSKCPKNCFQCIKNRKCFECSDEKDYYFVGNNENTGPIKCVDEKPDNVTGPYYGPKKYNYEIVNIEKYVYYSCMDGCSRCKRGDVCDQCDLTHILNKNKCDERVPHCYIYDKVNGVDHDGNGNPTGYTYCDKCKDNYDC